MTNWLQKLGLGLKKSSAQLTGGISDIFTKRKIDQETLDELEELLICSDLGVKASAKIIKELSKTRIDKVGDPNEIRTRITDIITEILKPCEAKFQVLESKALYGLFSKSVFNEEDADASTERKTGVYKEVHEDLSTGETLQISAKNGLGKSPCVVLMVGVNGAGKTTTIGKLISKLKNSLSFGFGNGSETIPQISLIAADTFRAAAVEQLSVWGERNKVRVYKGEPGCDAAGLCFDGLAEALKQKDDIVFIDTAGRLQNKTGLMEELKKVVKVIRKVIPEAPHHTLLCLDATTGQNALSQVTTFKEMVEVNGLIVNKLDGTAKGGILVAIAEECPTPIYYIGVGEGIDDLDVFNAADFAANLLESK